jgi:hypothetical protein
LDSPTKKKPKTMPPAKKIMGTMFWDTEGWILNEFLEPGNTIISARYVHTLLKLCRVLHNKHPWRNVIVLHDNAKSHCSFELGIIENMVLEVLCHPPTRLIWLPAITSHWFCEESDARSTLRCQWIRIMNLVLLNNKF